MTAGPERDDDDRPPVESPGGPPAGRDEDGGEESPHSDPAIDPEGLIDDLDDEDRRWSEMDDPADDEAFPLTPGSVPGVDRGRDGGGEGDDPDGDDGENDWTRDSHEGGDDAESPDEDSIAQEREDGWADGAEEPGTEQGGEDLVDLEIERDEDAPSSVGDDEEGALEPELGIDDETFEPLDDAEDEGGEAGDSLDGDGELGESSESADPAAGEDRDREAALAALPALGEDEVEVVAVGPRGEPALAIAVYGDAYVAAPGVGAAAPESALAPPSEVLADLEVTSLVVLGDGRILAGTLLGGAHRSDDGGATFVPVNGWRRAGGRGPTGVVLTGGGAAGVWARTQEGALYRSDDGGASWTGPLGEAHGPFRAIAMDEGTSVYGIARARLLVSRDRGQTWEQGAAVFRGDEPRIAARGSWVAVALEDRGEGLWLSADGGRSGAWQGAIPCPSAVAFSAGHLYLGVFVAGSDRAVLVRARPDEVGPSARIVFDVGRARTALALPEASTAADGDETNRIVAIAPDPDADNTVYLATAAGAFRIRIRG